MCLFPEEIQQPVLGGNRFFEIKVTIFIGRETETHIVPTKINETKFAKVSSSYNKYSFRIIIHSTTTTQGTARQIVAFSLVLYDILRLWLLWLTPWLVLITPREPLGGEESDACAYLRYARMSVAMALAEAKHHTAPRGQRTARAREEEREVHYTSAFRTTVPPSDPELFDLF